jgi:hypothetical protein
VDIFLKTDAKRGIQMRFVKRIFLMPLTVVFLFGLALGVGAETTEEDLSLEAKGRALLTETMDVLRGDFTIYYPHRAPYNVIHSNGNYFLKDFDNDELHLGDEIFWVFTDDKYYYPIPAEESRQLRYVRLLEPKAVAQDTAIIVTRAYSPYAPKKSIDVTLDGIVYTYKEDGTLHEIRQDVKSGDVLTIQTLTRTADQNALRLNGYKEASAWQVSMIEEGFGPSREQLIWFLVGNNFWGPFMRTMMAMFSTGVLVVFIPVLAVLALPVFFIISLFNK